MRIMDIKKTRLYTFLKSSEGPQDRISVLIPALNEEKTIARVIETAKSNPYVDEVIVIDDMSTDNTVKISQMTGARVISGGPVMGKGSSMLEGLRASKNDIIVYLDADIGDYARNIIDVLTQPILEGKADFVKSTFSREAGRVTELVAKPLLRLLFPEALRFSQPLSGMIAGRRKVFRKVAFENDYGVDIGILLDVINSGARIAEVNIGIIQHKMKPWEQLPRMSEEVAKAILKRAGVPSGTFYFPGRKDMAINDAEANGELAYI